MFKLIVLSAVLAMVAASPAYLGGPVFGAPLGYAHAPVAYSAPIVKAAVPVATSYANTYKVAVKAPVYAAAPVAYAAPAYHAPIVAAPAYHAPLAYSSPYGATYLH